MTNEAVPNTHTPQDCGSSFSVKFKHGAECSFAIARNGTHERSGAVDMTAWDYRRTVLRQDEIARFIHSSKGAKYSDLLPLLGLGDLEIAADNMRQLARAVEQQSGLKEMRGAVGEIARKRKQFFGVSSDADIETKAAALHKKYCPTSTTKDALIQCSETAVALTTRIEELTSEKLRYLALRELADLRLAPAINDVRDANGKLAASVEHLVFAEAVMMALAPHVGRQRAHDLVDAAVDETRQGSSFVDALRRSNEVSDALAPSDLKRIFDGEAHVDAADRVVADVLDTVFSPDQNENKRASGGGGRKSSKLFDTSQS